MAQPHARTSAQDENAGVSLSVRQGGKQTGGSRTFGTPMDANLGGKTALKEVHARRALGDITNSKTNKNEEDAKGKEQREDGTSVGTKQGEEALWKRAEELAKEFEIERFAGKTWAQQNVEEEETMNREIEEFTRQFTDKSFIRCQEHLNILDIKKPLEKPRRDVKVEVPPLPPLPPLPDWLQCNQDELDEFVHSTK
mmetsp:Transcript_7900/g.48836  ORF Transcript_7900/g.48836 Transcript_7900/m.48836 type:complete len:197 (+) Transcript_7900:126-716(+)